MSLHFLYSNPHRRHRGLPYYQNVQYTSSTSRGYASVFKAALLLVEWESLSNPVSKFLQFYSCLSRLLASVFFKSFLLHFAMVGATSA